MEQIIAAFITGLTAGGLSCLAVQGGLLASSLAQHIEQDLTPRPTPAAGGKQRKSAAAARRLIRQRSKEGEKAFAPVFLGALTVLIPCGITQAMLALAVGAGSPAMGAAILFAFTLGASPVFFVLAYFATQLGATLEKYFMRLVAVVVLVLGLLSVETGLNLMGSPLSVTNLTRGWFGGSSVGVAAPIQDFGPSAAPAGETIEISVSNEGYSPAITYAPSETPIQLELITQDTYSCALAFVIPSLRIERMLPPTGTTTIDLPAQKQGSVLNYSCSMGMYTGQIIFNQ
jgi:cytochrome c biogenesis protein CcdA